MEDGMWQCLKCKKIVVLKSSARKHYITKHLNNLSEEEETKQPEKKVDKKSKLAKSEKAKDKAEKNESKLNVFSHYIWKFRGYTYDTTVWAICQEPPTTYVCSNLIFNHSSL